MSQQGLIEEIRTSLFAHQDEKYREFQIPLMPTLPPESMVGVRTPELRKLAKEFGKREDIQTFLADLPHKYFDENQLHAFILSGMKDYEACVEGVKAFLPYVNNWATCDQMSPKIFKKHRPELLSEIKVWLKTKMEHFLDEDFDPAYPKMVAKLRSSEYYVNMMIAWYFATALAKQYENVLPYIEEQKLDAWTHNKTIQKAVESYRITPEQKEYLKSLKIKKK